MNIFMLLILSIYSTFALSSEDIEIDCDKAVSTLDINYCAGVDLKAAELEMATYLARSKEQYQDDEELIKAIDAAQTSWSLYAKAHCNSIYTMWREGSIRGVMALTCKTKATKSRTHEIWENFLTYMDSTPPILSEPQL